MERDDPLLAAARRLVRALAKHPPPDPADLGLAVAVDGLFARQAELRRCHGLLVAARRRGWSQAATTLAGRLFAHARAVRDAAVDLLRCERWLYERPSPADEELPTVRTMLAELRQLAWEFEDPPEVDLRKGVVVVTTGRVVLEGLDLGPFRIELHLPRLAKGRCDYSAFACVALDPRPAGGDGSVTHPHVRDGVLCAGDATAAIQRALRAGRVCDAFCLVGSVLNAYNRASPYVALDDWDGASCADCGRHGGREGLNCCDRCQQDLCDGCIDCCDACDASVCRGCLEREAGGERRELCDRCRDACSDCGGVAATDDLDDDGRCPACAAQAAEEDEEQETIEEEPDEAQQPEAAAPLRVPTDSTPEDPDER